VFTYVKGTAGEMVEKLREIGEIVGCIQSSKTAQK